MAPPKKGKNETQHIQVYARVRPLNKQETESNAKCCLECTPKDITVSLRRTIKSYNFDKVFGVGSKQYEMYKSVAKQMVDDVMHGYNCTIFAYGESGSGKTYTMIGNLSTPDATITDDCDVGIIPRALDDLFAKLSKKVESTVRVSFVELYNEVLYDLLASEEKTLKIYEDKTCKGSVQIHGLEEVTLYDKQQIYQVLQKGNEQRRNVIALRNAQPSRSHTIFSITVHTREGTPEGDELIKTGKLYFVDLAAIEPISKPFGSEKKVRETGFVNQSMNVLDRVIHAIVSKNAHVPYRESKLTRILQDSLGGKTKTAIIVGVSPALSNVEETVCALDYGLKAKNIINKPEVNAKISKALLIEKYKDEIDRLKKDIFASRTNTGIYLNSENYNEILKNSELTEEELLKCLEECSNLEERTKELDRLRDELQNVHLVTQGELVEATTSLNKSKERLKKLLEDRRIHQELIDKYEEAQTVLRQHTKALSEAVDKYLKEDRLLRDKVINLYSIANKNENTSKKLVKSYKVEHHKINQDFKCFMDDIKNQFEQIQIDEQEILNIYVNILEKSNSAEVFTGKTMESMRNHLHDNYKKLISNIEIWDTTDGQHHAELHEKIKYLNADLSKELQRCSALLKVALLKFKKDSKDDLELLVNKCTTFQQKTTMFCNATREEIKRMNSEFLVLSDELEVHLTNNKKFATEMDQSLNTWKSRIGEEFSQIEAYIHEKVSKLRSEMWSNIDKSSDHFETHFTDLAKMAGVQEKFHKFIGEGLHNLSSRCSKANKSVNVGFKKIGDKTKTLYDSRVDDTNVLEAQRNNILTVAKQYVDMLTLVNNSSSNLKQINQKGLEESEKAINENEINTFRTGNEAHYSEEKSVLKVQQENVASAQHKFDDCVHTLEDKLKSHKKICENNTERTEELLRTFDQALITAKSTGDTPKGKYPSMPTSLPEKVTKNVIPNLDDSKDWSDENETLEINRISDSDGECEEIFLPKD